MAIYSVTLPIVGYLITEVEADSPAEAVEEALLSDVALNDIEEWDVVRQVVRGNVCYAPRNNASAELISEDC